MKYALGTLTSGIPVYANLAQNPLAARIARNPHLLVLVSEAMAKLNIDTLEATIEQDMGRSIGYSDHLKTGEKDTIFYARTTKLPEYTRFVRQRPAEQTSRITYTLKRDADGCYELTDAWIGKPYPPVPSPTNLSQQSKEYWDSHAVVFNGQPLLSSTVTKVCPY